MKNDKKRNNLILIILFLLLFITVIGFDYKDNLKTDSSHQSVNYNFKKNSDDDVIDKNLEKDPFTDNGSLIFWGGLIFFIVFIIVGSLPFIIIFSNVFKAFRNKEYFLNKVDMAKIDVSEEEVQKYFSYMTLDRLKSELFDKYVEIYETFTNLDFDRLSQLCSKELYDEFYQEYYDANNNGGKIIYKDFKNDKLNINYIYEADNQIFISVTLIVSYIYAIVDARTEQVVDGDLKYIHRDTWSLEFAYNNKPFIKYCPVCRNEINSEVSGTCKNCGADYTIERKAFKLWNRRFLSSVSGLIVKK